MLTGRILSSSNLSKEVPLPPATSKAASIPVEPVLSDDDSINEGCTFCSDQEPNSEVYDPVDTYEPQLRSEVNVPVFLDYSSLSFSDDESRPCSEVHDPVITYSVDSRGSYRATRKNMPKWTRQVMVSGGVNPPDDGFTWRKFGRKDNLGVKFPREYYKCIHTNVQGCLATKQVQRSDEDPAIFEVTYRGRHTCSQGSTLMRPPSQRTLDQSQEPKHTPNQQQQHSHQGNPHQQQKSQELLMNIRSGLKVITENLDTIPGGPTQFPSFYFTSTSNNVESSSMFSPSMVERSFMGNYSPSFISPSTSAAGSSNDFFGSPSAVQQQQPHHVFGGNQNNFQHHHNSGSELSSSAGSSSPMGSEPLPSATAGPLSKSPPSLSGSPGSEDSDRDLRDQLENRDGSRKRKSIPRWTKQVRVSPGMGLEGPLEDGFSWRKYGQKDILGAKFPRGYYRCTHRNVKGCLATKQVQRSDADPTIFEVTYRGRHTCKQGSAVMLPPSQQTPVQSREPKHTPDQQQQHSYHRENLQQQPNIPGPEEWTSTSNNVSVESSKFWQLTTADPSKGPMFCILQQQHNHKKDQIKSEKVTQEVVRTALRVKTEDVDLNLFSPRPSFLSSCHLPSTSIKRDDVKGDMFSSLKFRTKPNCNMKELPFSSGAGSIESFKETGGINPIFLSQGEEYRTSLKFPEEQDVKPNCHAKKLLPFALEEKGIISFCLSQGYGTSLKFWECKDMKLISGRKVKDESMKSFEQVSLGELVFLEELQSVSWPASPPRSLPSNVSPKFLIKLNMAHSSAEQLWAGKQPLANLESIDLNHSKLTKIPDLSEAKKLGRLSLRGCQNLVETSSLQNLTKLEYLNLKGCKSLKSLPSMKNSKSLTTFILSGCSTLKLLPQLSPSIQYLYLAGTAIEELPPSIGSLSSLVKLDLRNCTRLRNLPSSICELESLDYLDISGCLTLLELL